MGEAGAGQSGAVWWHRVAVWDDEKVLEEDGGEDGRAPGRQFTVSAPNQLRTEERSRWVAESVLCEFFHGKKQGDAAHGAGETCSHLTMAQACAPQHWGEGSGSPGGPWAAGSAPFNADTLEMPVLQHSPR